MVPNSQSKIPSPKSKIELEPIADSLVAYAVALLSHYGFELKGYTAEELINLWLQTYSAHWIRLAVIEALYQGRYKAISVEQILAVWARRGQPLHHFNHDFERLISRRLPQSLAIPLEETAIAAREEYSLPLPMPKVNDTQERRQVSQKTTPAAETVRAEALHLEQTAIEDVTETAVKPDDFPEAHSSKKTRPRYDANWSRCDVKKRPIHQFTPPPDDSGFAVKLKQVARKQVEVPPKSETPRSDKGESERLDGDSEKV